MRGAKLHITERNTKQNDTFILGKYTAPDVYLPNLSYICPADSTNKHSNEYTSP